MLYTFLYIYSWSATVLRRSYIYAYDLVDIWKSVCLSVTKRDSHSEKMLFQLEFWKILNQLLT